VKFIPKSIYSFIERIDYQEQFPTTPLPEFNNLSDRWKQAVKLYRIFCSEALQGRK